MNTIRKEYMRTQVNRGAKPQKRIYIHKTSPPDIITPKPLKPEKSMSILRF